MPNQPVPCKISPARQISVSKIPVTINLCKDTKGHLATNYQFATVDVSDSSGSKVPNQPSSLKSNSFVLNLPAGDFDIAVTVAPAQGGTSKPVLFLYEACTQSPVQLCFIDTAISPGSGFHLGVTP
jgi:hypothetical protein